MKMALLAGLIVLFFLLPAHASEVLLSEAKIWQIRAAIEAQAEQIKRAQEIIESRTGVSKARIDAQLRIAEEDLIVQREKLEIYRDQLIEQLQELDRAVNEMKTDWKSMLKDTLDKVRSQILENNVLIRRLRQLQERAGLGDDVRWPQNGLVDDCSAADLLDTGARSAAVVSVSALPGPNPSIASTTGSSLSSIDLPVEPAKIKTAGSSSGLNVPVPTPLAVTPAG
jgi:predicted transcriptional regulator